MGRALPYVVAVVLTIYCLVDIAQSKGVGVRTFPRWLWALLVLVPFAGAVSWLLLGRSTATAAPARPTPRPRPIAPDDDPDFLRGLSSDPPPRESEFRSWEDELRHEDEGDGHRPE